VHLHYKRNHILHLHFPTESKFTLPELIHDLEYGRQKMT
jgi:hypothetical protein